MKLRDILYFFTIYIKENYKQLKTIKIPYKSDTDLTSILKQYSSIVRYSYNRFIEDKTEKDIRSLTKALNNTDLLNSWLIQCGILEGKTIQNRFPDKKVVFGGKHNFKQRILNKITKQEFQLKRLIPINIQGEMLAKGNRSFKLDVIDNNQIIFKLSRNQHIRLRLPNLRNNIKRELHKLQQLNEVKTGQKGYTYSIKLSLSDICISFEEFKSTELLNLLESRCLGIDMNPDTIGISVIENQNNGNKKILHAQEFSLKPIFNKILSEKLSSDSDRMRYYQNKLKHETYQISKSISIIARQFRCKNVFIEDLQFKGKSAVKISNRKNKNLWKRELFTSNLTKRLNVYKIKLYSVNPAYSSFIGNLMYDYTDAINASIEIARRGFEYKINKSKDKFYPILLVKHQWKEMAAKFVDWKKFYLELTKNLKLRYRVSLCECLHKHSVFKQNSSYKSMVINYAFYG